MARSRLAALSGGLALHLAPIEISIHPDDPGQSRLPGRGIGGAIALTILLSVSLGFASRISGGNLSAHRNGEVTAGVGHARAA